MATKKLVKKAGKAAARRTRALHAATRELDDGKFQSKRSKLVGVDRKTARKRAKTEPASTTRKRIRADKKSASLNRAFAKKSRARKKG